MRSQMRPEKDVIATLRIEDWAELTGMIAALSWAASQPVPGQDTAKVAVKHLRSIQNDILVEAHSV